MNFLRALVAGLFDALFGWQQKQAEKPKVITDAKTPKPVRDELNDALRKFVRDKNDRRS